MALIDCIRINTTITSLDDDNDVKAKDNISVTNKNKSDIKDMKNTDKNNDNKSREIKDNKSSGEIKDKKSPGEIKDNKSQILKLNIGGYRYSTTIQTLTTLEPECLFSSMFKGRIPCSIDENGHYFIDRNGKNFGYILDWLRDGPQSLPKFSDRVLVHHLISEANFYMLEKLRSALQEVANNKDQDEKRTLEINNKRDSVASELSDTVFTLKEDIHKLKIAVRYLSDKMNDIAATQSYIADMVSGVKPYSRSSSNYREVKSPRTYREVNSPRNYRYNKSIRYCDNYIDDEPERFW